jgi:hypothetical protein
MADWRTLNFQGYTVVARVAEVFEVGPPLPAPLPVASFTVKVLERANGSFAAHLSVAVRGPAGHPDGYAGLGGTPDEALADALAYFWRAVQERGASRAEDFVWAGSPEWSRAGKRDIVNSQGRTTGRSWPGRHSGFVG